MTRDDQEMLALRCVGAMEGGGFTARAGNFDGAGWSLGVIQWPFRYGGAQALLRDMYENGKETFVRHFRSNGIDYSAEILRVITRMSNSEAIAWADARSVPGNKAKIVEPWDTMLKNLLNESYFQKIQLRHAQSYVDDARNDAKYYGINTLRALTFFLNISVQCGQARCGKVSNPHVYEVFKAHGGFAQEPKKKMYSIIKGVSETADPRWQGIVYRRGAAIIEGKGEVYENSIFDFDGKYGLSDAPLV